VLKIIQQRKPEFPRLDAIDTSKTHRLYLLLKERITSGAWSAGQRLPSEPSLASTHGLSRVTIRRALDGLAREGLIRRQPGAGTFVADTSARPPLVADLTNMLAHLAEMGRSTGVRLLSFGYATPSPAVAAALRLPPGELTQVSVRVRSLDGTPFSHLVAHVPERIGRTYSERDLANRPLLDLLERSGVVAHKADQTISATLAGPDIAAALQVEIGSPLIALTRVVRDAEGRGIEHLSALYRPDMHSLHMEMMRAGDGAERHWRPTAGAPARQQPAHQTNASPPPRPQPAPITEHRARITARRTA
jgi:GntR family transcriptional regulator